MNIGAEQIALHKPQWPLRAFNVNKFGAYQARRTSSREGGCGVHDYPCTHWGVDLSAPEGTPVYVPHDGWLLYYGPADNPPFRGYGPYVALIAHADRHTSILKRLWQWATGPLIDIADLPEGALSVRYSLIGHLGSPMSPPRSKRNDDGTERGPESPPIEADVRPVALVPDIWDATKKKPNPDHWRPMKQEPQSVVMYTDADANTKSRLVFAGSVLGHVGNLDHVHWEVRTSPIEPYSKGNWHIDPVSLFREAYGISLPKGTRIPARDGGNGLLLLAAMFAFGQRKKRGRR